MYDDVQDIKYKDITEEDDIKCGQYDDKGWWDKVRVKGLYKCGSVNIRDSECALYVW